MRLVLSLQRKKQYRNGQHIKETAGNRYQQFRWLMTGTLEAFLQKQKEIPFLPMEICLERD